MKFLKFFNEVFLKIIFLFYLNYKSTECSVTPSPKVLNSLNILPIIKYYPKVFLNISESLPASKEEFKQSVKEMLKYTVTCENYLESELKNRMIESLTQHRKFAQFINAINMTNIWYKHLLKNLIDGNYPHHIGNEDGSSIDSSFIISEWLDSIEEIIFQNISTSKVSLNIFFCYLSM